MVAVNVYTRLGHNKYVSISIANMRCGSDSAERGREGEREHKRERERGAREERRNCGSHRWLNFIIVLCTFG